NEEIQDEAANEEIQDEAANEEVQDEAANEEVQDEAANEEVQDEAAETGSEVAGECCGKEECDSDEVVDTSEPCDEDCGCSDSPDADTAATASDFPVASLEMLLMTHHTQAVMALGMMPDPMTGETSANKDAAKFHIDMLNVIEEKTKGNLTSEESEALSSILHQLRMAFFAS
ncbi:MAG: DUF1844 domain-containing protein, partial [Planctomycetaceae bacterium]|nr:DUF1844 domain-containing protein [Planctomycetaceae bacterium]